jgi:FAD/FMN-containing dehydrogenase
VTTILDDLRPRLRGPLLAPGAAGYDDARSIWNAMIDRRPSGIVRCLGVADVLAGVTFAPDHGLALSIKGGGHNIAGLAVCDGGLTLDLSLMRGVWVDPAARTARAQAGCLLGDVDRETQVHGLAAVLGFVSNTGIAGLTLGGGFGYLTRRFGWTCDNVISIDLVTAEGRVVRASERENSDLFWGLRGGGGNFGVATSFEYALYPVGPEVVAGAIAWRAKEAREVLALYRALCADAPPELTCVALMRYVSQQSLIDATQPKGRRYYWKSEYLPRLEPDLLAQVIEHVGRIVSPHSAVVLFALDGALNRLPADHSAVGNRDAAAVLNITASWEQAGDDMANLEWARAAWRDMRRFSTGGTYVNFLTEEDGDERIRAAYGQNHARLVALKSTWDPDNLFRTNKNIAPLAPRA